MKIVKSLEDSDLLIKGATQTIKNETKEQKGRLFYMLLGTSGATLMRNMLAVKVWSEKAMKYTELDRFF